MHQYITFSKYIFIEIYTYSITLFINYNYNDSYQINVCDKHNQWKINKVITSLYRSRVLLFRNTILRQTSLNNSNHFFVSKNIKTILKFYIFLVQYLCTINFSKHISKFTFFLRINWYITVTFRTTINCIGCIINIINHDHLPLAKSQ